MSKNFFTNDVGREVMFGVDLPTGGCFYIEFLKDGEIVFDEVACEKDGLTVTEMCSDLKKLFNYNVNIKEIIDQFSKEYMPTQLQCDVCKMFGRNLSDMLRIFSEDLQKNYSQYLV